MNKEKISIIVPVYNLESYITRCVKSIQAQEYTNLEIILVDDGSTDHSLEVIKKLALDDPRIIIIHKKNEGALCARLTGAGYATGNWIGFIDGDDFVDPQMYGVLISLAENYHADIAHCGYQMEFPDHTDYYYNTEKYVIQNNVQGLTDLIEGKFIEPGLCNKLFSRELVQKVLSKTKPDISIKYNEDLLLNYYLFKESGCSVYFDRCYYHYVIRKGSASMSKVNRNKLIDPVKVLRIIMQDDNDLVRKTAESCYLYKLVYLATMNPDGNNQFAAIKQKASRILKHRFFCLLKADHLTLKLKMQCFLAAYFPGLYYKVHEYYRKRTGLDRKFQI